MNCELNFHIFKNIAFAVIHNDTSNLISSSDFSSQDGQTIATCMNSNGDVVSFYIISVRV